ncbi:MAG TPA: hypothetical protein VJR92_09540 [Gemmatimonadaceae bacterium]|nr:hypothetical protein [Gemmatimonadaceae bacterium]
MRPRVALSWSSGKDAAWALHVMRDAGEVDVVALLTTMNSHFNRVAMHGVRADVVRAQAAAVGVPLVEAPLPWPCPNEAYEAAMRDALAKLRTEFAITHVAFGDLFLEDVRAYREERMAGTGIGALFPIWGVDTRALAATMLGAGVRAYVTVADPRVVPREVAGREWDAQLLAELAPNIDPCAERGEFHTVAVDGPAFKTPLSLARGKVVERDGFVFADFVLR